MPIPKKLEKYCSELSEKLLQDNFPKVGHVGGEQILNFSPVKQVNLFLVKNLMINWRSELDKLNSPYFDFEAEEVKKGLEEFANTLSRHIKVGKQPFSELLEKSVREAVSLLVTPYEFYVGLAREASDNSYSRKDLKRVDKYIQHNKHISTAFQEKAENSGFNSAQYISLMESVFAETNASPEDPAEYLHSFSEILPLDESMLSDEDMGKKDIEKESQPTDPQPSIPRTDQETLNDKLKGAEGGKSLADIHQERKIDDLRASLNLNQRFMFIQGLFEGDEEHFNKIIDTLESLGSFEDARKFLYEQLQWDEEQEEVGEFLEMLSKRLS